MPTSQTLINELLDESIRARQRRLYIATQTEGTLHAFKSIDAKIDDNLMALASFGTEALHACQGKIEQASGNQREAAVHLLCAIAVQMRPGPLRNDTLITTVQRYKDTYRRAVLDALSFFPVGLTEFELRDDHLLPLLDHTAHDIRDLGTEATGESGSISVGDRIYKRFVQVTSHSDQTAAVSLPILERTLARLGLGVPASSRMNALLGGNDNARLHALELIACSGMLKQHMPSASYLALTQSASPRLRHLACFLAVLADPRLRTAPQIAALPPEQQACITALAGHPRNLIETVHTVTTQPTPPTSAQLDILLMMLGSIPVAAAQTPINPTERETQLRTQVLYSFRHSHVPVHNTATDCAWEPEAFLPQESLGTAIRLRYGQRMGAQSPGCIPTDVAASLSAGMRQALYWEQSYRIGQSFGYGLSAYAPARRQFSLLRAAEWHDTHLSWSKSA